VAGARLRSGAAPGRVVGTAGDQAGGERGAILDGLRGALSHERVHRMARVTEERRAADRPSRERLAIEQRPHEAGSRRRPMIRRTWGCQPSNAASARSTVARSVQSSRFQVSCSVQPTKLSRRPRETK
jgi:hypothetical protein